MKNEPDKLVTIEDYEALLGFKIPPETTTAEVLCWLEAKIADEERKTDEREREIYRAYGCVAPCDAKLFYEVVKNLISEETPMHRAMEFLRMKKRRGHKQQKALEIWDRHYARNKHIRFADEDILPFIDAAIERSEKEARARTRPQ